MNFAEYAQAAQLSDKQLYLRNQRNPPEARVRIRDWRQVGRNHLRNIPIRILRPSREESKGEQSAQPRGREAANPSARARAPSPPPPQRGWAVWRARAPAHLPGSAPRPAARSRPRAEATQSRSPTQRRWRRQQRRGPRGRSARALRAHLPHFGHRCGCPPAGLRWRRQQRWGKRQPRAESAGGAAAAQLRIPRPWRGSLRDHGFLGLLPARSGLEGTRLHVLLDRPFCRLRLALPSAAAAILCPGPGLRAAHALVPPLRDLATAVPPS
ncbi:uncharacterized protein [Macaca nemestrina]|uniref:uncharacterized protein n=1 Tax=Macaca nemestrina TaxID=9545 RepID=UPI0039B8AAF8